MQNVRKDSSYEIVTGLQVDYAHIDHIFGISEKR